MFRLSARSLAWLPLGFLAVLMVAPVVRLLVEGLGARGLPGQLPVR